MALRLGVRVCLLLCLVGFDAVTRASQDVFGSGDNMFVIEFVDITHPGNADDPGGYPQALGGVGYRYRMGKYEVSERAIQAANAAGNLGITTTSNGAAKPAGDLTFYEVARFVNWLNTSTGHSPAYNLNERGDWLLWTASEAWQLDGENRYRHKDAFYFVPSADEWYKAAYFDGTNYFRYPTGSNAAPAPLAAGTEPRTAVYGQPEEVGPADVQEAGGLSPYGTMAQGGNAWEWTETSWEGVNIRTDDLLQIRGGRWTTGASTLRASGSNSGRPWHAASLRVAALLPRLPMAPELVLRPAPDAQELELVFSSEDGVAYDIERAPTPQGEFVTIETLSGTGGTLTYAFRPSLAGIAFYRVVATRVGF